MWRQVKWVPVPWNRRGLGRGCVSKEVRSSQQFATKPLPFTGKVKGAVVPGQMRAFTRDDSDHAMLNKQRQCPSHLVIERQTSSHPPYKQKYQGGPDRIPEA